MGTPHFCGNGFYRGFHDRHDVAIFWNRQTVTPTNPSEMGILHDIFLRSEILAAETRHLQWRNFWCVKFKFVASPHVTFTAACTHSLAGGVKTQDKITEIKGNTSATKLEFKTNIALRALEKGLRYCHRSSLAADPIHFLVFLGDWNIPAFNFIEAAKDAKALAGDFTSEHSVMTARDTTERDHLACYYSRQHWFVSRDDNVPQATLNDLGESTNVCHRPLFFSVVAVVPDPAEELESPRGVAAVIAPLATASARAQVGPELVRLQRAICTEVLNADTELPAHPPVNMRAKSHQPSRPRTDPDICS